MRAPLTVNDALRDARLRLQRHGIPLPALEASLLLSHATGRVRAWLLAHPDQPMSSAEGFEFCAMVARRCRREPNAYITGVKSWMDFILEVNRNVLIPRPETELLAEIAVKVLKGLPDAESGQHRVVDVGTGSGALAAAIARAGVACNITAIDSSAGALRTATRNLDRLAPGRVQFVQTNLLAHLVGNLSVIVANLPYIPSAELDGLAPELRYEPLGALDGGSDGLDIIMHLIRDATARLSRGWLLLECGLGQSAEITRAIIAAWPEALVAVHADLAGIERVIAAEVGRLSR